MLRTLLALTLVVRAVPLAGQAVVHAGSAEIRLGGRLHVQYEHGSDTDLEPRGVFIRRARLLAEVTWGEHFEARIQPELAGDEPELEDAWVGLRPWPALRLSMGQFNRTLEVFELTSSNDLPVIERDAPVGGGPSCAGIEGVCSLSNLLAELSFVGRDQGVRLEWSPGSAVEFAATVTNGVGANRPDENRAKSLSMRATLTPRSGLAFSVFHGIHDYLVEHDGAPPVTRFAEVVGVDVVVGAWRGGPRFQGVAAWGDNWKAGDRVRFAGVHLLGSWYLPLPSGGTFAGIEPMLRLGWADGARHTEGAGEGYVFTPGVAAYIRGRNRIALNLDIADPAGVGARWSLKVQSYAVF